MQRSLRLDVERPLQKARARLVLCQPFIASIALSLDLVADSTCNTGWTDGSRLGFNPEWVAGLRPEQVEFFVAHEAYHVVVAHHLRRGGRDPKRWNIAADHVINLMLIAAGLKPCANILADPGFEGMSTEQAYARVPASKKGVAALDFGEVRDATAPGGGPLTEAERKKRENELKVKVAQVRNQEAALRRFGMGSGGTERAAAQCLRSEIDWRTALQNFVATVRTRDDYTWRRPNPRYMQQGLYLPLLQCDTLGDLVVVFDTSESIYSESRLIDQFSAELEVILAMFPSSGFHLLSCDTQVQTAEYVTAADSPLKLTVRGGGGTSFGPPFRWVEEGGIQPVGLVYFTDLEGFFPDKEPDYPVLWIDYGCGGRAPFGEVVAMGGG